MAAKSPTSNFKHIEGSRRSSRSQADVRRKERLIIEPWWPCLEPTRWLRDPSPSNRLIIIAKGLTHSHVKGRVSWGDGRHLAGSGDQMDGQDRRTHNILVIQFGHP
jgi:hypothetical protein